MKLEFNSEEWYIEQQFGIEWYAAMSNEKKMDQFKKRKIEQAQLSFRFFLEQFLIFMIDTRVKNLQSKSIENSISFIKELQQINKLDSSNLRTIITMMNAGSNQYQVLTYLKNFISDNDFDRISNYCFEPKGMLETNYCFFLQFFFNKKQQHQSLSNLIKLNENFLEESHLNELLDQIINKTPKPNGEYLTSDKDYSFIKDQVERDYDEMILNSIKSAMYSTTNDCSSKDLIKEVYSRPITITESDCHVNIVVSKNLDKQAELFGYEHSIDTLIYQSRKKNHLKSQSPLSLTSNLYSLCKSELFYKMNQVPKIIASLLEFDLRNGELNPNNEHVECVKDKEVPMLNSYQIKNGQENAYYMTEVTNEIISLYIDVNLMNDWKDTKSIQHRFRLGDKILHDYFIGGEKSIKKIMHNQKEKIKHSNYTIPLSLFNKFIILPLVVI